MQGWLWLWLLQWFPSRHIPVPDICSRSGIHRTVHHNKVHTIHKGTWCSCPQCCCMCSLGRRSLDNSCHIQFLLPKILQWNSTQWNNPYMCICNNTKSNSTYLNSIRYNSTLYEAINSNIHCNSKATIYSMQDSHILNIAVPNIEFKSAQCNSTVLVFNWWNCHLHQTCKNTA